MLELRPTCEHCDRALPPESTGAMICSFECTFCKGCAKEVLENVCPNCGGGFMPRPIRPKNNLKNGNYLGQYPATNKRTHNPVDIEPHRNFAQAIKRVPPAER